MNEKLKTWYYGVAVVAVLLLALLAPTRYALGVLMLAAVYMILDTYDVDDVKIFLLVALVVLLVEFAVLKIDVLKGFFFAALLSFGMGMLTDLRIHRKNKAG